MNNREHQHRKEQKIMFQTLLKLLNFKEDKDAYEFVYYDIENDSELISKLLEFDTDIRKCYYQTTSMATLRAKNKWFAFIKFIFKQNGFSLYSKRYEIINDDEKIKTLKYAVVKS